MSKLLKYKTIILSLVLSLFSSVLVFALTRTLLVRVFYSFALFAITFVFLLILFDTEIFYTSKFKTLISFIGSSYRKLSFSAMPYLFALFASAAVIAIPFVDIHVDPQLVWGSFASLSLVSIFKVVSGYFLISVFPGITIVSKLFKKYNLDVFGKICLTLTISYCYSIIAGLILISFGAFSSFTFIGLLWVPTVLVGISALRKRRIEFSERAPMATKFNLNSLMILSITLTFVASSYILVLLVGPHTGLMSGDVKVYMNVANEFANFGPFIRSPSNVWSSFFIWLTGYLTDLPLI